MEDRTDIDFLPADLCAVPAWIDLDVMHATMNAVANILRASDKQALAPPIPAFRDLRNEI